MTHILSYRRTTLVTTRSSLIWTVTLWRLARRRHRQNLGSQRLAYLIKCCILRHMLVKMTSLMPDATVLCMSLFSWTSVTFRLT